MVGIPGFGAPWSEVIRWMDESGMAEDLTEPEYAETFANFNLRILLDPDEQARHAPVLNRAQEVLTKFYASKTKAELYEGGQGPPAADRSGRDPRPTSATAIISPPESGGLN